MGPAKRRCGDRLHTASIGANDLPTLELPWQPCAPAGNKDKRTISFDMRRPAILAFSILGIVLTLSAQYQDRFKITWIEPGSGATLPEFDAFDSNDGTLGVLNASGPVNTEGHPFFTALGTNGRACVNCHQPTYGMSVSTTGLIERWRTTDGKDPVFAAFDGSNCPGLPQDQEKSHSLPCLPSAACSVSRCLGRPRTPMAHRNLSSSRSKSCATQPGATPVLNNMDLRAPIQPFPYIAARAPRRT